MFNFKNNTIFLSKGFALIELLVVITVMVILTGIIAANYNVGKRQVVLDFAALSLSQGIGDMRERAMSGITEVGCTSHLNYRYGYGIDLKLNPNQEIILFADCNGNNEYNENDDYKIKTIILDDLIEIESLSPNRIKIVFEPPDPLVNINANPDGSDGR